MSFAPWIRDHVDRAEDWRDVLARLRDELMASPPSAARAQQMAELAAAFEHVDPDRTKALDIYLAAYRDGERSAREPLLALTGELRAHVTFAEIALGDHELTREPDSLVSAARSFIDAGLLERAAQIVANAANEDPTLADRMQEAPELRDMKYALARARRQELDAESEINACLAHVSSDGPAAYLLAARIARLAELPRYAVLVKSAARTYPGDASVTRLFEDLVLESGDPDLVLASLSARLEAAKGEVAWVACAREAACELLLRNMHPGLGLRLLRTSLEHAYAARLPVVRRHVASWELLFAAARETRSTFALGPLLATALDADLPVEDTIYIAQRGLHMASRESRDPIAAYVYASRLVQHVPDHAAAVAFLAEEATHEPAPKITFRKPIARSEPVSPTPQPDLTVRAARKIVPLDVVIELSTGEFFSAILRDVSTSGAFVATKRPLEVGHVLELEIRLPVSRGIAQTGVRTNARVARRSDVGCGLEFIDPPLELVRGIEALLE